MRRIFSAAMLAAFLIPTLPVSADPPSWAPAHGRRAKERAYIDDGRKHQRRVVRYEERVWRGDDGRVFCRRSDGTTGLIIGAVAGGVIGNRLARGESALLGTLIGASAGAVIGQAVDKNSIYCE